MTVFVKYSDWTTYPGLIIPSLPEIPRPVEESTAARGDLEGCDGRAASDQLRQPSIRRLVGSAALTIPYVDALAARMLGIDEHRSSFCGILPRPGHQGLETLRTLDDHFVDLDTGHVLGIVDGRDSERRRGLAVRPAAAVAPGRAGRGNRPVSGVPQGAADVATTHAGLGRCVPPAQARQRHAHGGPATAHPAGSWPAGDAPSIRSGPTDGCCCGAGTHSQPGHETDSARCSPPASCRLSDCSKSSSGRCSPQDPSRRGCRERPPADPRKTSLPAGSQQSLANSLPLVERDRSPHCPPARQPRNWKPTTPRSSTQKDRPGIQQSNQLQNAYPVAQCRQNSGMNVHHGRTFTTNREEPVIGHLRAY